MISGFRLAALAEPEALAVHLEDVDVVGQAVEDGAGQAFRAEDCGSALNWHPTSLGRKQLKTPHFRGNRAIPIGADRDPVKGALCVAFSKAWTETDRGHHSKPNHTHVTIVVV